MKKLILNVANRHGTSFKSVATGKPWAMCRLSYLEELEMVQGEKFTQTGYGFDAKEIDLDPNCLEQFSSIKFPAEVELLFSPKPDDMSKNWVVGIKK